MAVAFKELHINRTFALADSIPSIVPQYIVDYYDSGYVGSYNDPANVTGSGLRPTVKTEFGNYKLNRNPSSNYNYFEVVNTEQDFDFTFRVFLNENTTQSELIPGTANTFHNGILEQAGFGENNHTLFQPLITVGTGRGDFYRNLVSPPPPGNITRANSRYNSFGFVYEGGELQLHYIDHITNASGPTNDIFLYKSSSRTISGAVTIGFSRRNGFDYFFNIEGYQEEPFGSSTITSGDMDNDKFITSGGSSLFGTLPFNVYELRYLYSDVCDIIHTIDGVIQFRYTFGGNELITDFGTRIDVENYIYSIDSTLELYNFALTDIVECNTCCLVADTPLVTSSNSELGCCFTPTVEDNIRYKINNWYLNSLGFSSIEYAEMMLKIGKNKEANEKLEKINSVHQFVFYIMSIRNRMVCEDKPYTDFVSDTTLNTFVEYFNCRGINIKCPLQIAMIGNFTNCCDQIDASVDCECTDEIPSAIISAPIATLDLINQVNLVENYTGETIYLDDKVTFSCCNGSQLLEVLSDLINPNNVPVTITPDTPQSDGTFSYSLTYSFGDSIVSDTKEFYVQFRLCGKVILRKHLYRVIDTCVNLESDPAASALITVPELDINNNNLFNFFTTSGTINLGNYTCCGGIRTWEIINIDTSRITPSLGLEFLQPTLGQVGQDNITYSYRFNGENAIVDTTQRVFITYRICNEFTYTVALDFNVVNNCVETFDLAEEFPVVAETIDLSTGSGEFYSSEIRVLDYNCCQQDDTFTISFVDGLGILAQHGITVLFPPQIPVTVQGSTYRIKYKYDKNVYLQAKQTLYPLLPLALKPVINIGQCPGSATVGSTIADEWNIILDDTCVRQNIQELTTLINYDFYLNPSPISLVNTTVTMINQACNDLDNPFTYNGIEAGSNYAYLSTGNTVYPANFIGGTTNLSLAISPYFIDLGDVDNPSYPVLTPGSELKIGTEAIPSNLINQTVQLTDNFFRSNYDALGGYTGNLNKGLPIEFNTTIHSSVFFLCYIPVGVAPFSLKIDLNGSIGVDPGDINAYVFPLGSVPTGGNYVPALGNGVAKIYNASPPNSNLVYGFENIAAGPGVFAGTITLAIANRGFYWVGVNTSNGFAGSFDITLSLV